MGYLNQISKKLYLFPEKIKMYKLNEMDMHVFGHKHHHP
jgi:hypothetical protein